MTWCCLSHASITSQKLISQFYRIKVCKYAWWRCSQNPNWNQDWSCYSERVTSHRLVLEPRDLWHDQQCSRWVSCSLCWVSLVFFRIEWNRKSHFIQVEQTKIFIIHKSSLKLKFASSFRMLSNQMCDFIRRDLKISEDKLAKRDFQNATATWNTYNCKVECLSKITSHTYHDTANSKPQISAPIKITQTSKIF